jgi:hypothetical protein
MKRISWLAALSLLILAPCASPAQTTMMTSAMTMGVGLHGYDFLIGKWTCLASASTAVSGPARTTLTFARSGVGSTLTVAVSGSNFAVTGYIVYSAKTKTWSNPAAFADGSYENESSTMGGKKVIWAGPFFDANSGQTMQVRDTYEMLSVAKYTDLGEMQSGGAWKKLYLTTCTKS